MNRIVTLVVAALALAGAGAAQAGPIEIKWTGTVTSGVDMLGLFSAPGTDLTGMAFTSYYWMDPDAGTITEDTFYHYAEGGADFGTSETPFLHGSMRINGHIFQVGNGLGDYLYDAQAPGASLFTTGGGFSSDGGFIWGAMNNQIADYTSPTYGDWPIVPISLDVAGAVTANQGTFYFQNYSGWTSLQLINSHLTIANGAVPEPASWAMMVAGFGLAGAAMRRHGAISRIA